MGVGLGVGCGVIIKVGSGDGCGDGYKNVHIPRKRVSCDSIRLQKDIDKEYIRTIGVGSSVIGFGVGWGEMKHDK